MKLSMTGIELLDYLQKKMGIKDLDRLDVDEHPISRTSGGLCRVYLTSFGQKKIGVIKEVRSITGLGLKEAKDLVEAVMPQTLTPEPVNLEDAYRLRRRISLAGGTAEVRSATTSVIVQQDRDAYLVTLTSTWGEKKEIVVFSYNWEDALSGALDAFDLLGVGGWTPEYRILPSVGRPF